MSRLSAVVVLVGGVILAMVAPISQDRPGVTGVTITRQELVPASVTGAGPYLKLAGTFRGAVDPADRRDALIADLALAPRVNGRVEYESTFYVLRPADPAAGNGKVFYDFGNRGNKRLLQWLNDGTESNDPSMSADFGHGFLMRQGYTVVWSGWTGDVKREPDLTWIALPVARNADGSAITGTVAAELIPSRDSQSTLELPYPAATTSGGNGALTARERSGDAREPVDGWSYDGPGRVRIPAPARVGFIYEFVYEATDPPVMGLGHAATRDFLSLLKYSAPNGLGAELMPGGARQVYGWGRSQGGRVQRDFVYFGFNEDLQGRQVFDGMTPYATGVGRMFMNVRWSQPAASSQQHSRRYFPEHEFPHRYAVATDPVTGATDGLLARCTATNTCPAIMNVESANEYWNKGTSLNHTDGYGNDLDIDVEAPNVRLYAIAGIQHNTTFDAQPARAQCQQLTNPLYNGPLFRALAVRLDRWVTDGTPPPASRVPRRGDGTLVDPAAVDFPTLPATRHGDLPAMPAVQYHPESAKPIALLDLSVTPARVVDPAAYWRGVTQVDADGNEVAGIRLPDLVAPTGTYTGWALMQMGAGGPDLCGQLGQFIPFATSRAERLASGDPRLSLEERYGSTTAYVDAVAAAAQALEAEGLLLAEDRERIIAAAAARGVLAQRDDGGLSAAGRRP